MVKLDNVKICDIVIVSLHKERAKNMANSNKHYTIDETNKVIYADILSLTEKEEAEVFKFSKFGYSIQNRAEKKDTVKRIDDAFILDYLKDDSNAIEKYKAVKNAPAIDKNGNQKLTSTGKARTKGFNAGRNWFSKTYPTNIDDVLEAIEAANKTKALNTAYEAYANKTVEEGTTKLNKDEYTRDFYWKKVFVNTNSNKKTTDKE